MNDKKNIVTLLITIIIFLATGWVTFLMFEWDSCNKPLYYTSASQLAKCQNK